MADITIRISGQFLKIVGIVLSTVLVSALFIHQWSAGYFFLIITCECMSQPPRTCLEERQFEWTELTLVPCATSSPPMEQPLLTAASS